MNLDTVEQAALNAAVSIAIQRLCRRIKDHNQLYNDPLGVVNDEMSAMLKEIDTQQQNSWVSKENSQPVPRKR